MTTIKIKKDGATNILFLDMKEISSVDCCKLVINKAKKSKANPVLQLGDINDWDRFSARPWGGSVIYDEEEKIFKMWYLGEKDAIPAVGKFCTDKAIGYAVSKDGLYWEKPALDIFMMEGMAHNNIVYFDIVEPWGGIMLADHFCVIKDYLETDINKKYKGFTRKIKREANPGEKYVPWDNKFNIIYSRNGINWRTAGVLDGINDPTNIVIDDEDIDPVKRIKMFGIAKSYGSSKLAHNSVSYGPDFEYMVMSPKNPVIEPDNDTTIHLFCGLKYEGYYINFYNYSFWRDYYGYKGSKLREKDKRAPDGLIPGEGWGTFIADTRLAVNRDGVGKFTKVNSFEQVIERGEKGQWDDAFLVTTSPVVKNGDIYLFYSATSEPAASHPHENDASTIRCGLAKIEKRRLTYLTSADGVSAAIVTTVPIEINKGSDVKLEVNAGELMPYRDWIEVEVFDAQKNEILPGFQRRDCSDIFSDGFDIPVSWKGSQLFEGIRDKKSIVLKFYIYGKARLYSFSLIKSS